MVHTSLTSFKTLLKRNSNVGISEVKECTTFNSCWTCKNQHLILGSYHTVILTTLTDTEIATSAF